MRKVAFFTATLLLTVGMAVGQQSYPSGETTPGAQQTDLRGCLSERDGQFILKQDGTGTEYQLTGNTDDLREHIGEMVQVSGHQQGLSSDTEQQNTAAAAQTFEVSAFSAADGDCSGQTIAESDAATSDTATADADMTASTTAADASASASVETDTDVDATADADVDRDADTAADASQAAGTGVQTAGTTGPTTHIPGRVDPDTGTTTTSVAGGTSISPDRTASGTPDQQPFGQEDRTGEPATGTAEATDTTAQADLDAQATTETETADTTATAQAEVPAEQPADTTAEADVDANAAVTADADTTDADMTAQADVEQDANVQADADVDADVDADADMNAQADVDADTQDTGADADAAGLPQTASPLPLLALLGIGGLLAGFAARKR